MPVNVGYICFSILTILAIVAVTAMFIVDEWWQFRYTSSYPWTAPMGTATDGSSMIFWVTFMLTITRMSAALCCTGRSANSRSTFLRYFTIVILLIAFVAEIAAVAVFFVEQNGCNDPPKGDPGTTSTRFCNDPRWCCVYGTIGAPPANTTPVNLDCPLTLAACVPAVSAADLTWSWVFTMNFSMTWIFMVLWVLLLACSVWMRRGLKRKVTTEATYEDDGGINGAYDDEYTDDDNYVAEEQRVQTSIQTGSTKRRPFVPNTTIAAGVSMV